MPTAAFRTTSLALLGLLAVAACSSQDGRTLPPAGPVVTTTTSDVPTIGSEPGDAGVTEVFTLYSTAFVDGGPMPARHTCDGDDVSPPLDWVGVPPAAELALVARDVTAGGSVLWIITDIDTGVFGIGEGGIPESATAATNSFGERGWTGPCPPEGEGPRSYVISLHVLPEPLVLDPAAPAAENAAMVEAASTLETSLTAVYSR